MTWGCGNGKVTLSPTVGCNEFCTSCPKTIRWRLLGTTGPAYGRSYPGTSMCELTADAGLHSSWPWPQTRNRGRDNDCVRAPMAHSGRRDGGNTGAVLTVWMDAWQLQCCGQPFNVGSTIDWTLAAPSDREFLASVLGDDLAGTVTHHEEHHGGLP